MRHRLWLGFVSTYFRVPLGAYPKIRDASQKSDPRLAGVDVALFDPNNPPESRVVAESNDRGEVAGLHAFLESAGCEVCITEDSSAFKAVGWGLADFAQELRRGWFRRSGSRQADDAAEVEEASGESDSPEGPEAERGKVPVGPTLIVIGVIAALVLAYALTRSDDDANGPGEEVVAASSESDQPSADQPSADQPTDGERRGERNLTEPEFGAADSASDSPSSAADQSSTAADESSTRSESAESPAQPEEEEEDSSEAVVLTVCFLAGLVFAILVGSFLFRLLVRKFGAPSRAAAGTWGVLLVVASLVAVALHVTSGPAELAPEAVVPPAPPSLDEAEAGAVPHQPGPTTAQQQPPPAQPNSAPDPSPSGSVRAVVAGPVLRPPVGAIPCPTGGQRYPQLVCHIRYRYAPPTGATDSPQPPELTTEPDLGEPEAVDPSELQAQLEDFVPEQSEVPASHTDAAAAQQPGEAAPESSPAEPDRLEAEKRPMRGAAFFLGALLGTTGVWWRWRKLEFMDGDAEAGDGEGAA